jgi:sec-independent protein translocase protein TatA
MGDVAKGIKSFKKGISEDDTPDHAKTVDHKAEDTKENTRT